MTSPKDSVARSESFWLNRNVIGAGVLLATLGVWSVGYRAMSRTAESAERSTQSQEVFVGIRGVLAGLSRVNAAARNPTLSGDRRLGDFRAAASAYRADMTRLRRLLADDPDQIARLDMIEQLVSPRLTAFDAVIAAGSPLPVSGPASVPLLVTIDKPLGELQAHEQLLAEGRAREAGERAHQAVLLQTYNAVIALLTLLVAFYLLNRDVTKRERDEALLREALKGADAASEAKTHFLTTVSHEIRTPLNAVSGMSELLLETRLDPEQIEFARAVRNNADSLALLIGDLLDSSRIEAGQVFLEAAPFDLRELAEGVAELLVVRAEAKGVELIVDVPPSGPRRVVGDRARLRQVLVNLVGNAVKFTERGEVTIRLRVEPADGTRVSVRLAVIDTGIGIAPEAQDRIFERFMQANRSVAHQYGGTGLGLNISRSLIELMGGRLSLQSEVGVGSTFEAEVTLPLAPTQPAPDITPESLAGLDVLLVRRNAARREVNESLLRYAGATFRGVGTAAEANEEIARRVPHVMVVGEVLPDSTGIDLAKKIWNDRYGQTPVIKVVQVSPLRAMAARNIGSYGIAACVYTPAKQVRLVRAIRVAAGLEPKLDERRSERAGRPQTGPKRPRILLVEDNRDAWLRATHILGARYEVDRAENGLDAVASAAAIEYDLVLMDVALPQIDGIEATKRIRAREADTGKHVPIVALTAHAIDSVRQEALAAGMDDYATKPIGKQQLLDVCAKWADRRPLLLIADDSPDNQLLLTTYMRGSDYRLSFVATGKEAVDAAARRQPSLILLDMNMPVMDGYEAARTIRRLPGGDSIPILALTSHDGPHERERCLEAGCTDFMSKPVHRNDVLERVAALLGDRGAPVSPEPTDSETTIPSADGAANRLRRQLALRDFEGVAALAVSIGSAARAQQLTEVAAVCEELADSARSRDSERSAWWSQQLIARLRLAWAPATRQGGYPSGSAADALARLALLTLGVPTAGLTRNSQDRVLIVGAAGVPTGLDVSNGFPLANSLSRVIVETKRPLVVEDVRTDPRLNSALIVLNHSVAAVAALPLTDQRGAVIGAFWALDDRPRSWPPREIAMLENIAAIATQLIDSDRAAAATVATAAVEGDNAVVVDDDIVPLMPDYVAGLRQDVAAMRREVEGGDMVTIASRGHKMKGSGAGYCLPRVSKLGREIEDAARGGDPRAVRALIDDLDGHLTRLRIRSADGRVSMEL